MYEALAGIKRGDNAERFNPETMIDTLFDYPKWLTNKEQIEFKGSKWPKIGDAYGKTFAIVGAGASGLIAAWQLALAGATVHLFEASDRPGGRMCSVQYKPESTTEHSVFELGCMRFPPSSRTFFYYLDKFGIKSQENFPDPGVDGVYAQLYYQNKLIEWHGRGQSDTGPDDQRFKDIAADFNNMMIYLLGDVNDPDKYPDRLYYFWRNYQRDGSDADKLVAAWQKLIDQYNNVSFEQGILTLGQNTNIVKNKWGQAQMDAFAALGVGSGGFGPLYNVGFLEILRLIVNGFEYKQRLVPSGISELTDKIISYCKGFGNKVNFYYNSPVKIVSYDGSAEDFEFSSYTLIEGNGAQLSTGPITITHIHHDTTSGVVTDEWRVCDNNGSCIAVDGVIVATTNRSMQMMGLTTQIAKHDGPDFTDAFLSADQKTAIRSLHMTSSSKFFVRVKKKFWLEKTILGKLKYPSNIQSDEIFRGLYCLDYCPDPNNPVNSGGGVVLISYTWEDDSTKLLGLTKKERYEKFLAALTVMNPAFAKALDENKIDFDEPDTHESYDLTKTNMIDWQAQPHYYGAFKLDYPGTEQMCHDLVYQFQAQNYKNLTVCGDSISWVGGWMEGALTSGLNAACAAVKSAGGTVYDGSPLTGVSKDTYKYGNITEHVIY